jgi:hypothetical protein
MEKKWRFLSGVLSTGLTSWANNSPEKRFMRMFCSLTCALVALCFLPCANAQDVGDPACSKLMLVSSYFANNVKIYNHCDGSFIRNLDSDSYLQGPQAIALDPQGRLVVVSESNGRLVRYHRETLTYDTVIAGDRPETPAVEPTPVSNPTGLVITPAGRMLVGSFNGNTVSEINPENGQVVDHLLNFSSSGIQGPDTGMLLDGNRLLVPGFDSSTIVEVDITQPGSDRVLVPSGSGGINAPRTIVKMANGNLLVTSWRGNKVLEYDGQTGSFVRIVTEEIARPTGLALESEDVMLLASDASNDIHRVRISDGQIIEKFIAFNNGFLQGPTFIMILDKQTTKVAENRAFWLIGVGEVQGKSILINDLFFTTGGSFGDAFDPDIIGETTWGSILIDFDSCGGGDISWTSINPAFHSGAYEIFRLADDPLGDLCLETGFSLVDDSLWMSGVWYGGPARGGEGLSINLINDGLAIVTWYSYLPKTTENL